jgi:hypothetical protein
MRKNKPYHLCSNTRKLWFSFLLPLFKDRNSFVFSATSCALWKSHWGYFQKGRARERNNKERAFIKRWARGVTRRMVFLLGLHERAAIIRWEISTVGSGECQEEKAHGPPRRLIQLYTRAEIIELSAFFSLLSRPAHPDRLCAAAAI